MKQSTMAILCVIGFGLVVTRCAHAGDPIRPNPKLTPGATITVPLAKLCMPGYASQVRNVPESEKQAVYREYGIAHHATGQYEIDHLISLELGGSNDIKNLWVESYITKPLNAHVKDKLENRLHALVCHGKLSLKDAQMAIRTDWVAAYRKYVEASPTTTSSLTWASPPAGDSLIPAGDTLVPCRPGQTPEVLTSYPAQLACRAQQ